MTLVIQEIAVSGGRRGAEKAFFEVFQTHAVTISASKMVPHGLKLLRQDRIRLDKTRERNEETKEDKTRERNEEIKEDKTRQGKTI